MKNIHKYFIFVVVFVLFQIIQAFFAIDFPKIDDILFLETINSFESKGFSLDFLKKMFSVGNNHILFFPKLLVFVSYLVFGNVSFSFLIFFIGIELLLLCLIISRDIEQKDNYLVVFIAFSIFQIQNFETALWSLSGIQHFTVFIFSILAFKEVVKDHKSQIVYSTFAFLTSGNGVLTFLICLFYLFQRRKKNHFLYTLATFSVLLILYFYLAKTGHSAIVRSENFYDYFKHFCLLFTSFITNNFLFSLFYTCFIIFCIGYFIIKDQFNFQNLTIIFCIGSILLISITRTAPGDLTVANRFYHLSIFIFCFTGIIVLPKINKRARVFLTTLSVFLILIKNVIHVNENFYAKAIQLAERENYILNETFVTIGKESSRTSNKFALNLYGKNIWCKKRQLVFSTTAIDPELEHVALFKYIDKEKKQEKYNLYFTISKDTKINLKNCVIRIYHKNDFVYMPIYFSRSSIREIVLSQKFLSSYGWASIPSECLIPNREYQLSFISNNHEVRIQNKLKINNKNQVILI